MNPRTVPYHKLPKRIRQSMLKDAERLSAKYNEGYTLSESDKVWIEFMRTGGRK